MDGFQLTSVIMGQFSTGSHIVDQSTHFFIGFEAWTYPWLAHLFWIYQSTDSGDNTLDYEAYGTGYLAAVAYAAQRQAELVEGLQGALMAKKGSLPHSWQWKKGFTDSVLWNAMVVPLLLFCLCCGFLAQLPCPCCSSCGEFRSCRCSAPSTRGLYGTRCAPAAC